MAVATRHLMSVETLTRSEIGALFDRTGHFLAQEDGLLSTRLTGSILGILFTQPSIRTRNSFFKAFVRLGGSVLQSTEIEQRLILSESNEALGDVLSYFTGYVDILALRTGNPDIARMVTEAASVPVISAGISGQEHPVTALAKAYSVFKKTGRLQDHKILLVCEGESRTFTSLLKLFPKFGENDYHILTACPEIYAHFQGSRYHIWNTAQYSMADLLDQDYSLMIFDESERTRCSPSFVQSAKLEEVNLSKLRNLEHLIHLKPVVELFDDAIKNRYLPEGVADSHLSTMMKSAVLFWLLDQNI